ncbi:MAG: hypothetical protein ACOYL6_07150 [Bacteriovoracaceae bacterium]
MRLMIFISVMLLTQFSFARFPEITAKNLSLDLKNNAGVGFVNFLKYNINNITLTHTALQAQVKKYPDRLIVNDAETQIEFAYPLDFLNNFSAIDIHEVNLVSKDDLFTLDIDKAIVDVKGMNYEMDKLYLSCQGRSGAKHAFDSCTDKSMFQINKLVFQEGSKLSQFFTALSEEVSIKWNPFKVKFVHDFNLEVNKSKLVGEIKVKSLVDITFNMEGTIAYNEKNDEFKIELLKAKAAGFIDVKKRIFKELANLNIKELKVEPPYIYIKLQ